MDLGWAWRSGEDCSAWKPRRTEGWSSRGQRPPTLPVTLPSCATFCASDPGESHPLVCRLLPTQSGPGRRLGSETAPRVATPSAHQGGSGDGISVHLCLPANSSRKAGVRPALKWLSSSSVSPWKFPGCGERKIVLTLPGLWRKERENRCTVCQPHENFRAQGCVQFWAL